ncbi:hypothetical protein B7463_g11117, partial [Scytalidium lignicola]
MEDPIDVPESAPTIDLPRHIQDVVKVLKDLPRPKRMQGSDVFVPQRKRLKGKNTDSLISQHFRPSTGELRLSSELRHYPLEALGFSKPLWLFFNGKVRVSKRGMGSDSGCDTGINLHLSNTVEESGTVRQIGAIPIITEKGARKIRRSSSLEDLPTQLPVTNRRQRRFSCSTLLLRGGHTSLASFTRFFVRRAQVDQLTMNFDPRAFTGARFQRLLSTCYFRSWTMTCEQLQTIVTALEADCLEYKQITAWKYVAKTRDPGVLVTLRYVGKTEAPRSPYRRFLEDTTRVSAGSRLLRCFLSALQEKFPEVSEGACSYLLTDSVLPWFPGSVRRNKSLVNLYESFLISIFDIKSLLNVESGGSYFDFSPPIEDEIMFLKCHTSLALRFKTLPILNSKVTDLRIKYLFRDIQLWTMKKAANFNNEALKMSDKCVETFSKQASPCNIGQYTIVAFCGRCKTKDEFTHGLPFFNGDSKTSTFVNFMFRTIADQELEQGSSGLFNVEACFPFIDLYNWYPRERKDIASASAFLQRWLQISKPIVTVTFGSETSAIVCSSFQRNGKTHGRFGQTSTLPWRLSYLAFVILWVFLDTAVDVVQRWQKLSYDRQSICEQIMAIGKARQDESGLTKALEEAKSELSATFKKSKRFWKKKAL